MNSIEWELIPINKLCLFTTDCVNKTAPVLDYITPYKMIRTTNIKGGFIDLETVRYVNKETFDKWTRRSKPKFGDVILTREAPVGSVGRYTSNDENVFLGQRLFHYRPNPELLDWNYLAYFLQSEAMQGWLNGIAFGATVSHITVDDAKTIKIPCPPVELQRKIGNLLSNYDNLIQNNTKRIKLLEEMAKELYKEWFIRLRFPEYEKSKIVDGIPEGWEEKRFINIIKLISGYAFKSDDFDITKTNKIVVRMGNFKINGGLKFDSNIKFLKSNILVNSKHLLKAGDMLIVLSDVTREGSIIGNVGIIPNDNQIYVLNQRVSKLIFDDKFKIFLYTYFNSFIFKNYCLAHADSATVLNLSNKDLYKHKIILPSLNIVKSFTTIVKPIYNEIDILIQKNQILKQTRDLLLPRVMSGKLDVRNLPEENNL